MLGRPEPPIFVDDETTWPAELRRALDGALPELRRYEAVREEFDARAEQDIVFRLRRPSNPHAAAKLRAVEDGNRAMAGRDIIGFHCSRLHDNDVADLRASGFRPLAAAHLHQRIEQRLSAGDIPPAVALSLRASPGADNADRARRTWFVFTRALLQDESGIWRLLRSWGGEALYSSHEYDQAIAPLLRSIGVPSIVKTRVPADDVEHCSEIGERLRRGFLLRRDIRADNDGKMEGYVRTAIGAERIMDIYRFGQPAFERLTQYKTWAKRLA
jgi:hypothetical protein